MKKSFTILSIGFIVVTIVAIVLAAAYSRSGSEMLQAIVILKSSSDDGKVMGKLHLTQGKSEPVKITGKIHGLETGKHGFHVHQYGDLRNGCKSAGGHYNPYSKTHGAPEDENRHVGDLGNIIATDDGEAIIDMKDKLISLEGEFSVYGRAFVVHQKEDDLGKEDNEGSKKTGNAGARVACGIIAVANPETI